MTCEEVLMASVDDPKEKGEILEFSDGRPRRLARLDDAQRIRQEAAAAANVIRGLRKADRDEARQLAEARDEATRAAIRGTYAQRRRELVHQGKELCRGVTPDNFRPYVQPRQPLPKGSDQPFLDR